MAISRRRFIRISGAAAGLGLLPNWAGASAAGGEAISWHGVALGAAASMQLYHEDPAAARALIARVVTEVDRLESIFSLYRIDSALSELNRRGVLVAPPPELVELLAECDRYWRLTNGAFDPTVQPLWECYTAHFSKGDTMLPPPPERIDEALGRVGWRHIRFDRDIVVFARKDMAITLNGIAQGYITDAIVKLLAGAGIGNALVDMGEIRAIGGKPGAQPWRVELDLQQPETSKRVIALVDRAVATSSAQGFVFDHDGTCNHLLDPATGRCASPTRSVSVVADRATRADALSTAFELMDREDIRAVLGHAPDVETYVSDHRAMGYSG